MNRFTRSGLSVACLLSCLAGYVDAAGFIQLGGAFVSFMSGNSTRLGIDLVAGRLTDAALLAAVIAAFFAGAFLGGLVGQGGAVRRRPLLLVTVASLLAIVTGTADTVPLLSGGTMAVAMGVENAVFQRPDGTGVGLTYMTGAVVKAGQEFANTLVGRTKGARIPHLTVWASLMAGAALGAYTVEALGHRALWVPVATALLLAPVLALADRRGFLA